MKFTGKQNSAFEEHVLEDVQLLGKAVEWIKENMNADQVFDKQLLSDWVGDNCKPGDVFAVEDLETWAEANGYVKL